MSKLAVKQKRNKHAPRVAYAVASNYWIRFSIHATLTPEYEQEPLTHVSGEIIFQPNRDEDQEVVVGHIDGYVVRGGRVVNDGYSFYEACDAESGELEEIAATIWDQKQGGFREDLVQSCGDLIAPTRLTILPAHRGKGVGLLALWRFLDFFGSGAAIAVIKPFPLNHCGRDDPGRDARDPAMGYDQFKDTTLEQGTRKLAAYYGRLGFDQIPGTDLYYINMEYQRPALEDLLERES